MQRMNDVPAAPAAHRYVQVSTALRTASPTRATCQPKTLLARSPRGCSLTPTRWASTTKESVMKKIAFLFALSAFSSTAIAAMCPDGTYVSGDKCYLAPDGSYVGGGRPRLAPDGSYVGGGRPSLAPDGSYVGGSQKRLCPDGSYVAGTRCRLMPNGKYVGE